METKQKNVLRRLVDKLYGGLNMSWPAVILFAVGTAVLTTVFLVLPVFKNTSFARMGVTLEAWIFFAVIIMANCKKPLESALKTFVFFLISQPLIYLFQVPFSSMGWGLFGYYTYWFIFTLLTFPMAFVGWYICKKNWLSVLILLPVLAFLSIEGVNALKTAFQEFPRLLITGIFCLGQVFLYGYAFMDDLRKRLVGILLPIAAAVILLLVSQATIRDEADLFLPEAPYLSEEAFAVTGDPKVAYINLTQTGEYPRIGVRIESLGTTDFEVWDGEKVYRYRLEMKKNENGGIDFNITPLE